MNSKSTVLRSTFFVLVGIMAYFAIRSWVFPGQEDVATRALVDDSLVDASGLGFSSRTGEGADAEVFYDREGMSIRLLEVDGYINKLKDPVINEHCRFAVIYAEDLNLRLLAAARKSRAKEIQYFADDKRRFLVQDVPIPYTFKRSVAGLGPGIHKIRFRVHDFDDKLYEAERTIRIAAPASSGAR